MGLLASKITGYLLAEPYIALAIFDKLSPLTTVWNLGSFAGDAEAITAKIEDNKLNLYYSTLYSTWKETVLEATEDQLKILNENNVVYLYKRYQPINLDID